MLKKWRGPFLARGEGVEASSGDRMPWLGYDEEVLWTWPDVRREPTGTGIDDGFSSDEGAIADGGRGSRLSKAEKGRR
jgi:hypothetical protein